MRLNLFLFLGIFHLANAATNSAPFIIPAIVELMIPSGRCTGTIVGDKPIKVITAVHCLDNQGTGGVQMKAPSPITHPRYLPNTRWIASKKAYVSQDPAFQKALGFEIKSKNALRIKESELKLLREKRASSKKNSLDDLNKIIDLGFEVLKLKKDLEIYGTKMTSEFLAYDIAILVFDESLPGDESLEEKVKNLQIIPLSTINLKNSSVALLGGFGVKGKESVDKSNMDEINEVQNDLNDYLKFNNRKKFMTPSEEVFSSFTQNEVWPHQKVKDVYTTYGYIHDDIKKFNIPYGQLGAPLEGDSGGPALTEDGINGVASMIRTYSSDKAPKSDWKNAENSQSAFDAYNYIAAHYASSSSDIARAIIEQVEKENSPLAYDFQFPFFKENFHSLQTQLKTATQN